MVVTWDAVNKGTAVVLSNNNLTATIPGNLSTVRASEGKTYGKWYWEIKFESLSNAMLGIVRETTNLNAVSYGVVGTAYYYVSGTKYPGASAYGSAYTVSDTISVLLDMDLGTIEFWKNGISQGIMFNDLKNNTSPVYPAITSGSGNAGSTSTARFNIKEFTYQPPEGYLAYDGSKSVTNKILLLQENGKFNSIISNAQIVSNVTAIPTMTSNTTPSGVASARVSHNSYQPYLAFNDDIASNGWFSLSGQTANWLSYEFTSPIIIGRYSIAGSTLARLPKDFTFEGSNDGTTWTVLDTRANVTDWVARTYKQFDFINDEQFLIYRLNISANNGDSNYTIVDEMKMFEVTQTQGLFFNEIPSHSEKNFIDYGMDSPVQLDGIFTDKNYILQDTVSENAEGLWTTQINRKPLSIKFN